MTVDPRTPVIVGVAQRTVRPDDAEAGSFEPLDLQEQMVRAAAADAGAPSVVPDLDSLQVVYCMSWPYDDPVARLAERLGASPTHCLYSGIGGTTPLQLLHDAASAVARGDADTVAVCGAETLATKRRLKKAGERPAWSHRHPDPPPFPFEAPFHPAEVAHEVFQAWLTFALFDVARRARFGIDPATYRAAIGDTLAPLSRVAAANPHAWFPIERTATELVTPTPDNRLVGYPYTKLTVAVMDVDMASAFIVMSTAAADAAGVADDRRVYLRGYSYGADVTYVAERDDMASSPAMAAVLPAALGRAGLGIDDVAHLDLYSCFASSLHTACDALGLTPADGRGLTVTGGLPFAGGPASNYCGHSLAAMVDAVRAEPGTCGFVTGVGMHLTKHAAAVLSSEPAPFVPADDAALQAGLDAGPTRSIIDTHAGPGRVATYSVVHGRDGSPEWALVIVDVADGGRCYARAEGADLLAELEAVECVGAEVELAPDGPVNRVRSLVSTGG